MRSVIGRISRLSSLASRLSPLASRLSSLASSLSLSRLTALLVFRALIGIIICCVVIKHLHHASENGELLEIEDTHAKHFAPEMVGSPGGEKGQVWKEEHGVYKVRVHVCAPRFEIREEKPLCTEAVVSTRWRR